MFQALIAKLAQLGRSSSVANTETDGGDVEAVLRFEQLVGELHLAAMQIAVVASGINAIKAGIRLRNPLALRDLGPQAPDPAKIAMPRTCREELGIPFKHIAAVRDLFVEVKAAQREVEAFCADAEQFGTDEAAFLDIASVSDRWQCLGHRALSAVAAVEQHVQRCLPARYSRNTPLLKQLLRRVVEGGHPCVDQSSTIKLPDLPQRRAAVRPNVLLPCLLEYHGMTFQATAKDISTGGVGLQGAPALVAESVVLLEFEGDICLAGVVVWSRGARAGIKFDTPLKPNHKLLATSGA
jgi:PilZ domain